MLLESLSKPENAAAVWSAIAASFSALAAYLSWRAQIKTLKHTFRPELVLSGWKRTSVTDASGPELIFSEVKNTGRDTALHVFINVFERTSDGRPMAMAGSVSVPSLAPNEVARVDGGIVVFWQNVTSSLLATKMLGLRVTIHYWDHLGSRHTGTASLVIMQDPSQPVGNVAQVAPGVYLQSFSTVSTPVWQLKLRALVNRIPFIRRSRK